MAHLKAAVVGAGLIGLDLIDRLSALPDIEIDLVIGRRGSRGLAKARAAGHVTSDAGLGIELANGARFDVIFDASDAHAHKEHWQAAKTTDALVIDLTPSHLGIPVVPIINATDVRPRRNVNLITCAGQASIPLVHALAASIDLEYVEVVATAASASVGPATRRNTNEFVETTAEHLRKFTSFDNIKFMANMSPALPSPAFRLSISMIGTNQLALNGIEAVVAEVSSKIRTYAPGYHAKVVRHTDDTVVLGVTVKATSPFIPEFAGNLEIINGAAVQLAQNYCSRAEAVPPEAYTLSSIAS